MTLDNRKQILRRRYSSNIARSIGDLHSSLVQANYATSENLVVLYGRIYWKHVFKNFRLYQIVVLNWIFDKMNIFVLAFCTQAWTSSFFVPKMLFEPYNFRYFLRVLRVLHGIPRTQLEQTRLQRRVQLYNTQRSTAVCTCTHYSCVHTHTEL